MKAPYSKLLLTGVLATLGIGAMAQPQVAPTPPATAAAPQPSMREHGPQDRAAMFERRQQRMERRLGSLKQELKITPQQESAWNTWAAAVRPGARMPRPDRAELERLSTPERIERLRALRAQRMAEMDKRLDATATFYATLTLEQKKLFDEKSLRFARAMHRRHHE